MEKEVDPELQEAASNLVKCAKAVCGCAANILSTMDKPPYNRNDFIALSAAFCELKRICDVLLKTK